MKHLLFFASLLSITSLRAMQLQTQQNKLDLRQALTTIAQYGNLTEHEVVQGLLNPTECKLRAVLLDAQLQQSQDKRVIEQQDKHGDTNLMREIIGNCRPDIAQTLLQNDADPTLKNKNGETALHLILDRKFRESTWGNQSEANEISNNLKVLSLLLQQPNKDQFINIPHHRSFPHQIYLQHQKNTPLLHALYNLCPPKVIKQLIDAGADIYSKTEYGSSVIHLTGGRSIKDKKYYGREEYYDEKKYSEDEKKIIINAFIARDEKLRESDQSLVGQTPLIDQPDTNGNTPLMAAMTCDYSCYRAEEFPQSIPNTGYVDTLLTHKPNIYLVDSQGATALHGLLNSHYYWFNTKGCDEKQGIKNREEILKKLLTYDLEHKLVNIKDKSGLTPLMTIQMAPRYLPYDEKLAQSILEIIKILIEHGADVTVKNNAGENFINYLVKHSNWLYPRLYEIIDVIPEAQRLQIINEVDNQGNSPVINASDKWFANSDSYNYDNYYPAYRHSGARKEFPLIALLDHRANINSLNQKGQSALEIAYECQQKLRKQVSHESEQHRGKMPYVLTLLWKSNPKNKWNSYRKYYPFRYYSTVAGITAGIGLAGYATWRAASSYFGWQLASIYAPIAKLFNNNIQKPT